MTPTATVIAQAKINLGLRVLGREASGYHTLETLFHRIELADEVRVRRTAGDRSLTVTGEAVPAAGLGPERENLAWRAAAAYADAAGWTDGFAIDLVKRIPVGGGLGGGSADAGAVLRACDRLADRPMGAGGLQELASGLGADVPFLASTWPAAFGWGRGDRLLELPPLPQREVVLVVPSFAVSTVEAYRWLAESRRGTTAPGVGPDADHGATSGATGEAAFDPAPDPLARPGGVDWDALAGARNDFEPIVAARHPAISGIVDALTRLGARPAMLSGSGSATFGVFDGLQPTDIRRRLARMLPGMSLVWTRTAARVVPVAVTG